MVGITQKMFCLQYIFQCFLEIWIHRRHPIFWATLSSSSCCFPSSFWSPGAAGRLRGLPVPLVASSGAFSSNSRHLGSRTPPPWLPPPAPWRARWAMRRAVRSKKGFPGKRWKGCLAPDGVLFGRKIYARMGLAVAHVINMSFYMFLHVITLV